MTRPRILVHNYGHARVEDVDVPLNSVLLTNAGAVAGCNLVGDVVDISPPIRRDGVQWSEVGRVERVVPADALYCQASVSLEVMRRFRELCPSAPIILQRDSTHAAFHWAAMRAQLDRFGYARDRFEHVYERDGYSLLKRELEEYEIATRILVLSRFVERTFLSLEPMRAVSGAAPPPPGISPPPKYDAVVCKAYPEKVRYFGPQLAELHRWPHQLWSARRPTFTVIAVGSIGLRKGTLDLLRGWRAFVEDLPPKERRDVRLLLCGLPDGQDPPGFSSRAPDRPHMPSELEVELDRTPQVERAGWTDMRSMPAYYRQAHAYICVSHEEGSIMSGVEAALSGCALLYVPESGIDVPGFATIDNRSAHEIGAWLRAAREAERAGQLGLLAEQGQRWAREHCGVDAYARRVARRVAEVLG